MYTLIDLLILMTKTWVDWMRKFKNGVLNEKDRKIRKGEAKESQSMLKINM